MIGNLPPVWIQTYSGRALNPVDVKPEDVFLEDLAHAGSIENRFSGHSIEPYSINEHQIRVSTLLWDKAQELGWSRWHRVMVTLQGFLHDAHEALGWRDLARPIKYLPEMAPYREGSRRCQEAVWAAFGVVVTPTTTELVRWADDTLLATEKRDLMVPEPGPWNPLPPPLIGKIVPYDWRYTKVRYREGVLALLEELENLRSPSPSL